MSQRNAGGGKAGSKKGGVGGGLVCAHCKKAGGLGTMKCCGRCKRVHYCSVACQKSHWKIGGHKKVCGKEGGSGARGDGAGVSVEGDAPLQNPCPLCLDSEDDAGKFVMCYTCGQMYCEKCSVEGGIGSIDNCPTCRAVLRMSDQEKVRHLRCLLERPWGRYTPVAQFILGLHCHAGTGIVQDHAQAVRLFRLAAGQGLANAQFCLGDFYHNGTGVDQDHTEAVRWYRLAADQGHGHAQLHLGDFYHNGTGVDQDHTEAVRWYRLAADQGHADAQLCLGDLYYNGAGVDQDHTEAVRWYRLAADQGYAGAQYNLAKCYRKGTGVDRDRIESVRLLRLAANKGLVAAEQVLSQLGL